MRLFGIRKREFSNSQIFVRREQTKELCLYSIVRVESSKKARLFLPSLECNRKIGHVESDTRCDMTHF